MRNLDPSLCGSSGVSAVGGGVDDDILAVGLDKLGWARKLGERRCGARGQLVVAVGDRLLDAWRRGRQRRW